MEALKISSLVTSAELAEQLGNYAKSSAAIGGSKRSNDGGSDTEKAAQKSVKNRALRYEMHDTARSLLRNDLLSKGAIDIKQIKGAYRVVHCRHTMMAKQVGINKSASTGKCFYTGLVTCGSVWSCPLCSVLIQSRRSVEVSKAIESAYNDHGLSCSMITLTFPHYSFQSCKYLIDKQKQALKYFRESRAYKNMLKEIGYKGLIRGLEVVYGSNGWHPHTHELWFHKPSKIHRQTAIIKHFWFKACDKAGLIPKGKSTSFKKHAVDIKLNVSSGDYLQKSSQDGWGIDKELTSSSLKSSSKGLPPFALLESANSLESSDREAHGQLFVEYAKAFAGKRQLYWTNGLKDFFNVDEKTDEEIANEDIDKAYQLGNLDGISWLIIRKNKARFLMLYLIENGGFHLCVEWLKLHGVNTEYIYK